MASSGFAGDISRVRPGEPPVFSAAVSVAFVGSGPGDPGLVTLRAAGLLAAADFVVADATVPKEIIAEHVGVEATVVVHGLDDSSDAQEAENLGKSNNADSPAEVLLSVIRQAQAQVDAELSEADSLDLVGPDAAVVERLIVRLVASDPATYSVLLAETAMCRKQQVSVDIIPGVSALTAVPMYAGVPLGVDLAGPVHILPMGYSAGQLEASACSDVTVVLEGSAAEVGLSLERLLDAGRPGSSPVTITQAGATIRQSTHATTLQCVANDLRRLEVTGLVHAVVGKTVPMRSELSWWENKPLFGWRVLVPRTREQARGMALRLEKYGATSEVVPTISVEPPRNPQRMQRAISGLVNGRYAWVGFTSANAVRAVRERFTELGLDVRSFAGLKIAAVGGVTADRLREWGMEPALIPTGEQSARGLLEVWPPFDDVLDPIDRVFLPRADIATETLVAGLLDKGWQVDDVTAYRTVRAAPPPAEVRADIKGGRFDAVCFTSSSTVKNLVGIAGKPHSTTVIACIGQATADTAAEHGLRVDVVAPQASALALVDALAGHGQTLAQEAAVTGAKVLRPSERRNKSRRRRRKPRTKRSKG